MSARVSCVLVALVLGACGPEASVQSIGITRQGLTQLQDFGTNPGGLNLYELDPPTPKSNAGLVVALHGCTQSAAWYETVGWDTIAAANGFYLLYAETTESTNCFQWWDPALADRDGGQAASILQGVRYLQAHHHIDASKIFVTGFSAGGAMTAMLLGDYPDVFAAGSINSGVPYDCARTVQEGVACQGVAPRTPSAWGDKVRAGFPGYDGPYPRVQLFQGTSDLIVLPQDETELMKQWTDVQGIDQTPDLTEITGAITHQQYQNDAGVTLVDSYLIAGMPHAVAVEPLVGCGTATTTNLDVGLCSPALAAQFFGLVDGADGGSGGSGSKPKSGCSTGLDPSSSWLVLLLLLRRR